MWELVESLADAFMTLDRQWRITYANPEVLELVRSTPAEVIGLRPQHLARASNQAVWSWDPETGAGNFDETQRWWEGITGPASTATSRSRSIPRP